MNGRRSAWDAQDADRTPCRSDLGAPRRWVLLVGLVHFVLFLVALVLSFDSSGLDDGSDPPAGAAVWGTVADILVTPGRQAWGALGPAVGRSNAVEWAIVLLNSLLWGLVLGAVGSFASWLARRNPGSDPPRTRE
jgi:hypothetical protein